MCCTYLKVVILILCPWSFIIWKLNPLNVKCCVTPAYSYYSMFVSAISSGFLWISSWALKLWRAQCCTSTVKTTGCDLLVHIRDRLYVKETQSELSVFSWFADVTTAINGVVIENIDFWIVIEYHPLMMHFLKKKKIENKYLHFSWISSYWHSNNMCIKYMLIFVTCAIQVRLESEGSCWPFLMNLVWTWSLSNVHLCHLHVIWHWRMALQCSCMNPQVSMDTWHRISFSVHTSSCFHSAYRNVAGQICLVALILWD